MILVFACDQVVEMEIICNLMVKHSFWNEYEHIIYTSILIESLSELIEKVEKLVKSFYIEILTRV